MACLQRVPDSSCSVRLRVDSRCCWSTRAVKCYLGAAQDLWGILRQRKDHEGLLAGLGKLGVKGLREALTGDELDAATAAWWGGFSGERGSSSTAIGNRHP